MKTILFLLALVPALLTADEYRRFPSNCLVKGCSLPVHNLDGGQVDVDSSATDTSSYFFNLLEIPRFSAGDSALGTMSVTCKDSTGSDSIRVSMYPLVSYAADQFGTPKEWNVVNDTADVIHASGTLTQASSSLTITDDPRFIKFVLKGTTAQAATCYRAVWNFRPKLADN